MCSDGTQKIRVSYNSPIKTGGEMEINLRISNSLGFVECAEALFNRRWEEPGADKKIKLNYNKTISNEEYSVFTGKAVFYAPGYRTFFIKLKLDGEYKTIKYNEEQGVAIITDEDYPFWEMFVYHKTFTTPDWVKGGIMYQIFVDTFCSAELPEKYKNKIVEWGSPPKWKPDKDGEYRNNQFYGGNIRGIIQKLPYIKSLGVTVIYLTPIFQSPSSNKYDISNYWEIDEMFGSWEDLDELHKKANEMGMYLVVDCVFNHSSSENHLLQDAPEMYDWLERYTTPKCWWGYKHLVEFNKYHQAYLEMLKALLQKYKHYMDGIRIDVADSMPDFTLKCIKQWFGKYVLGEVWKNAINGEFREFLYGDELDGVMNYQFPIAIYRYLRWANVPNFRKIVNSVCRLYPKEALAVSPIFLSSHDIPRIPNILVGDFMKGTADYENVWDMEKNAYWYRGNQFDTEKFRKWENEHDKIPEEKAERAFQMQRITVFMQYTFPGLPSIFAGDEAGVTGFKDPFNRKPFPWNNIEQQRYEFYCEIGRFRIAHRDLFAESDFEILGLDVERIIYRRDNAIFIVNRSNHTIEVPVDMFKNKKMVYQVGDGISGQEMYPYSAAVFM